MASEKKVRSRKIHNSSISKKDAKGINKTVEKNKNNSFDLKKNKVKPRKIRMSMSRAEEKKLDKVMEKEDTVSVMVMVLVLIVCFIVGISLGYLLYKIAITGNI